MNLDLFSYNIHQSRHVSYDKTVELAKSLQGEISYRKTKAILKNHDFKIEYKEFYNFTWKITTKKLNASEKLRFLLAYLDKKDFQVYSHKVYTLHDEGNLIINVYPIFLLTDK